MSAQVLEPVADERMPDGDAEADPWVAVESREERFGWPIPGFAS
jgi:hypothetical protein